MSIKSVTLRYSSSRDNPTVLIELPIHVANKLVDGHENTTVNLFNDIRKAIEFSNSKFNPPQGEVVKPE